jgi:large subunit ribosomal protein L46
MKYLIKSTQSIISRGFASTASNASNKKILAGAILSRIPQITPTPTGFEKAYLDHCHKLSKRESLPFPADLYFKKGTVNERRWKEKLAQEEQGVEAAVQEENNTDINNIFNTFVKKNSRITEADKKNDIKSLERKLDQFLYLIVKNNNEWQFPNTEVKEQPALDQVIFNY